MTWKRLTDEEIKEGNERCRHCDGHGLCARRFCSCGDTYELGGRSDGDVFVCKDCGGLGQIPRPAPREARDRRS